MGRGRTDENDTSRRQFITLCMCKRLVKKMFAVLCSAMVAALMLVVFSSRGSLQKCARFSRPKMATLLLMTAATVLVMAKTAAGLGCWESSCLAGNFTPGDGYSSNLDAVAAILPSIVGSSPLFFGSESVASPRGEEVYAQAQCWRLASRAVCKQCVEAAFRDGQKRCQFREGAVIFRDKCTIIYNIKKIKQFPDDPATGVIKSKLESSPVVIQGRKFKSAVAALQEAVIGGTVRSTSSYFTTGEAQLKSVDIQVNIYAAAQCVPLMTDQDCNICLEDLLEAMQPISTGPDLTPGRVASIWCSYRFSFNPFFQRHPTLVLPAAEPPGIVPPPPSKHQHNLSPLGWVAVGAGGATTIIVVVVAVVCCCKRNLSSDERQKTVQWKDRTGEEERPRVYSGQVESQPSALERFEDIVQMAKKKEIALFLDYDGTLAPIVRDPDRAYMSNEMRGVLQTVANMFRTSVVSGRECGKVFNFVKIKNISYAGSHGTDIQIVTTTTESTSTSQIVEEDSYQPEEKYVDVINEAYNFLVNATGEINGAYIEHNKLCVSLHYRNVAEEDIPRVQRVADETLDNMKDHVDRIEGKMVHEFRVRLPPDDKGAPRDKGTCMLYILNKLGDLFPIFIGDDRTDEDAFKVIRERNEGVGILVAETGKETHASYSLKDPAQVMEFLKMLVEWKQHTVN